MRSARHWNGAVRDFVKSNYHSKKDSLKHKMFFSSDFDETLKVIANFFNSKTGEQVHIRV